MYLVTAWNVNLCLKAGTYLVSSNPTNHIYMLAGFVSLVFFRCNRLNSLLMDELQQHLPPLSSWVFLGGGGGGIDVARRRVSVS